MSDKVEVTFKAQTRTGQDVTYEDDFNDDKTVIEILDTFAGIHADEMIWGDNPDLAFLNWNQPVTLTIKNATGFNG